MCVLYFPSGTETARVSHTTEGNGWLNMVLYQTLNYIPLPLRPQHSLHFVNAGGDILQ